MSSLYIEPLADNGGAKFWIVYEHGNFHSPIVVLDDRLVRQTYPTIGIIPMPSDETIANAVKLFRKSRKLSQAECADAIGISRNYLSQVEGGEANISLDVYRKIERWITV